MTPHCSLCHKLLSPAGKNSDFSLGLWGRYDNRGCTDCCFSRDGQWHLARFNCKHVFCGLRLLSCLRLRGTQHLLFKALFERDLRLRLFCRMVFFFLLFVLLFAIMKRQTILMFCFGFALHHFHHCCLLVFCRIDCWKKKQLVLV